MAFNIGKIADGVASLAKGMADEGLEKVQESLSDFSSALAILGEAGYDIRELEIELGVTPKITAHFKINSTVDDAKLNEIVQRNPDKTQLTLLVMALLQTNKLRDTVKVNTLKLEEVEIGSTLGAVPNIVVRFK